MECMQPCELLQPVVVLLLMYCTAACCCPSLITLSCVQGRLGRGSDTDGIPNPYAPGSGRRTYKHGRKQSAESQDSDSDAEVIDTVDSARLISTDAAAGKGVSRPRGASKRTADSDSGDDVPHGQSGRSTSKRPGSIPEEGPTPTVSDGSDGGGGGEVLVQRRASLRRLQDFVMVTSNVTSEGGERKKKNVVFRYEPSMSFFWWFVWFGLTRHWERRPGQS